MEDRLEMQEMLDLLCRRVKATGRPRGRRLSALPTLNASCVPWNDTAGRRQAFEDWGPRLR